MTTRRILVIDDLRTMYFPAEYARTSEEGLAMLEQQWDEIWLDHDLGGDDTISPVVNRLCEMSFLGTPVDVGCIIVHSSNPVANTIPKVLERYGYECRRVDAFNYLQ